MIARNRSTQEEVEPHLPVSIGLVEDPAQGCSGPLWLRGRIPLEAAVIVDTCTKEDPRIPPVSAIIPLSGEWRGGDFLTVARSDLPAIDDAGIDLLFSELVKAFPKAPWVSPSIQYNAPPNPELRPRIVAARSKHQIRGNYVMLQAHLDAVKRGEVDELPEFAPEDCA